MNQATLLRPLAPRRCSQDGTSALARWEPDATLLDFLADLPRTEVQELLACSRLASFRDGQTVYGEGAPFPGLVAVASGALKVFKADDRGHIQFLDLLGPGQYVGEAAVLEDGPANSRAEAHGPTECWIFPIPALRRLAQKHPQMAWHLLRSAGAKVRRLMELVDALGLHTVPERVARLILDAHARNPTRVVVEFQETQEDLAERVGSSREAFSRALRQLANLGLIQNSFPVVRVPRREPLEAFARGN